MYISWETIITAGAVVSALALILGLLAKAHKRYLKQDEHGNEIAELKKHHEEDVHRIKEENYLICFALSACLDGLMQQGCNHTVPKAKAKLDEYLNQQAHE
jgi:predicted histidine transporter YuiF (NhaC family)